MSDVERIAAGLSKSQPKALFALSAAAWLSAADVKHKTTATGLDVLYQMNRRNPLCERRTIRRLRGYEYRLTPLGLAVRNHLLSDRGGE